LGKIVVAEFISLNGIDEVHEKKPKYTRLIRLAPNHVDPRGSYSTS
jgi:hypothetical protein